MTTPENEEPRDEMAELRSRAEKYGPGYAVLSGALSGKGVDRAVAGVKLLLVAVAAVVVLGAIASKL